MIVPSEQEFSEDDIFHYGVLGMKWGQRKKAGGQEIASARGRLHRQREDLGRQEDKLHRTKPDSKAEGTEARKLAKMHQDYQKNPDRVIATRMTRGEKALAVILAGPFAAVPIAATSAASRRIEYKQDKKSYDQ